MKSDVSERQKIKCRALLPGRWTRKEHTKICRSGSQGLRLHSARDYAEHHQVPVILHRCLLNCTNAAELSRAPQGPPQRARHGYQLRERSISVLLISNQKYQCFVEGLREPIAAPSPRPCAVGKLPFSWRLNKFGSNSSPWLLKTTTKTTIINYSVWGPGGNFKTSFQGQGFSGNRFLLTTGRAFLSWRLHLEEDYTVYCSSVLEQRTGTLLAASQHTEGLTLHFMTGINPRKVCAMQSEGKRNQFWFPWAGFHHLIRERNESLKYTYRKGICHLHERWEWLHPQLMKSSLLCLFEDFIYLNYANIKYNFIV